MMKRLGAAALAACCFCSACSLARSAKKATIERSHHEALTELRTTGGPTSVPKVGPTEGTAPVVRTPSPTTTAAPQAVQPAQHLAETTVSPPTVAASVTTLAPFPISSTTT